MTHFSALLTWRRGEYGNIYVLLQDNKNTDILFPAKLETKLPGGTNVKNGVIQEETPLETLKREVKEEIWLTLAVDPKEFFSVRDSKHIKHFFCQEFSSLSGYLRDEVVSDESSELSVPYWVRLDFLNRLSTLGHDHRRAIVEFQRNLTKYTT